jgi:cell pole-organizing protein PopZ
MEDILASIRRILNEDEKASGAPPASPEDVLMLDESMLVENAGAADGQETEGASPEEKPSVTTTNSNAVPEPPQPLAVQPGASSLVAPEVAAAAASSVEGLVRKLAERGALVSRSGPSLEDLVREEIRPILKEWLDTNLPPIVERLVRAEIERVVARSTP